MVSAQVSGPAFVQLPAPPGGAAPVQAQVQPTLTEQITAIAKKAGSTLWSDKPSRGARSRQQQRADTAAKVSLRNVEEWDRQMAQAPEVVREYIQKKGLAPEIKETRYGASVSAPGMTVQDIARKVGDQLLKKSLKEEGWQKYFELPSGLVSKKERKSQQIWTQRDEAGDIVGYSTWDELSSPQTRAASLAAASERRAMAAKGYAAPTYAQQSQIGRTAAAQLAQQQALAQSYTGFSGTSGDFSGRLGFGGVVVAAGLLGLVLWALRKKG